MVEWDSDIYPHVILTSEHLTWDPLNPIYVEQEGSMTDFCGDIIVNDPAVRGRLLLITNSLSSLAIDTADITKWQLFYCA